MSPIPEEEPASQGITTTVTEFVYIRVRRTRNLLGHWTTAANPPNQHLYLIAGELQEIRRYAGSTVDWVIKVAHLICAPTGVGQVYTHTTGTSEDWVGRDRGSDWREVRQGDPLLPGIYEFESSVPIFLSRLSQRQSRSRILSANQSSASTFRRNLRHRDADKCVITGSPLTLVASHLIPKRMGTEGVKNVFRDFVGAHVAQVHRFHPMIGILLNANADKLVDLYHLGFYHNTVSTHTCSTILLLNRFAFTRATPTLSIISTPRRLI